MSPTAVEAAPAVSTIYLVRHAESMANVANINLPHDEAILTYNGKHQAKLLGEFLKNEKFTKAIASTYPRAKETAQIILGESAVCKDIPLELTPIIREREFGIYENGGDIDELVKEFRKSGLSFVDWVPEGGETRTDMETRIERFLQDVFTVVDKSNDPQNILAVTHGDVLTHLFVYLYCAPKKYILKNWTWVPQYFKVTPNTGYFKLAIEKNPEPIEPRVLEVLSAHENPHLKSLGTHQLIDEFDYTDVVQPVGCSQQ